MRTSTSSRASPPSSTPAWFAGPWHLEPAVRHAADRAGVRTRAPRSRGRSDCDRATARALVLGLAEEGGAPLPRAGAGTMATIPRGRARQPPSRASVDPRGGRGRDRPPWRRRCGACGTSGDSCLKGGTGRAQSWRFPSASERTLARARALTALGGLAYWQNDVPAVRSSYEEALGIARELGDHPMIADGTYNFAFSPGLEGDRESARTLFRQSMEMFEQLGDPRGEADSMWALSLIARLDGDLPRSLSYAEEASAGTERSAMCSGSSTRCTSWAGRRTRWAISRPHRRASSNHWRSWDRSATARASPSCSTISRRRS